MTSSGRTGHSQTAVRRQSEPQSESQSVAWGRLRRARRGRGWARIVRRVSGVLIDGRPPLQGCMTAGIASLPPWGPGTRTGSRTRRSRGSRASRPNGIHAGRAPPGAAGIRGWGLRLLTRRKISTASTLRHPRSRAPGKERSVAAHRPQSTAVSEAASVLGRSAA